MTTTKPQITMQDIADLVTDSVTNVLNTSGNLRINSYDGNFSYKALEFKEFEENARAKSWSDKNKYDRFGTYVSAAAKDWYRLEMYNMTLPADWDDLKKSFIDYFLPKDKTRYYREQLNRRKQSSKEPVNEYILSKRLKCLKMKSCHVF